MKINREKYQETFQFPCMPFIRKVFGVLNDSEFQNEVTWAPHGNGLSILNPTQFTTTVLENHFEGIKFESF